MRRIGWQSRTRAKAIREQLDERLQQWRLGWFGDRLNDASVLIDDTAEWPVGQADWQLTGTTSGMWIGTSNDAPLRLAAEALQLPAQASELVQPVGKACLEDLLACLWGVEVNGKPEVNRARAGCGNEDLWRSGGLAYRFMGLPVELLIVADRGWCDAQFPQTPSPKPALTDRRKAIGGTRVVLKASVDLGDIPLLESTGWAAGELFVTDRPRTLQASLSLADRKVHGGVMGLHGRNRALVIS